MAEPTGKDWDEVFKCYAFYQAWKGRVPTQIETWDWLYQAKKRQYVESHGEGSEGVFDLLEGVDNGGTE